MTDGKDDKNAVAPAEFRKEAEQANSINHTQSEADRFESGERNPDAAQETAKRRGRPPAQPTPNVTLSRANENGTPKPMVKKSNNEVSVRVTKKGDGQVSTGGAPGEVYERGATFEIDRTIAEELEDRGFVEID